MHVKTFSQAGSNKFPSITLCFQSGKIKTSLEGIYNKSSVQSQLKISVAEYRDILLGKIEGGKDMKQISSFDFEKNTLNIWNYLKQFKIKDKHENDYIWKYDEAVKNLTFEYVDNQLLELNEKQNINYGKMIPLVPNYLDPNVKCFTHQHFLEDGIMIDTINLYFSVEKLESIEGGRIYIYVHQRKQLIRNMRYLYKVDDFSSLHTSNTQVVLELMSLKVVKNRHDAKDACDKNLKNDDQEWMKHVAENVSCLPSFWSSVYDKNANFSLCRAKKELETVAQYLVRENEHGRNVIFEKYKPPCQMMQLLANIRTANYKKDGVLHVKLRFRYLKQNTPQAVNYVFISRFSLFIHLLSLK
jgi:hypothetical protein